MLRQILSTITFLALVCIPLCLNADTFDNEADWLAALCTENNNLVSEEYNNDLPDNSFITPIDNPYQAAWGTFTANDISLNGGIDVGGDEGLAMDSRGVRIDLDSSLGLLDGFSFCYSSGDDITFTVNYVDGSTEMFVAPTTGDVLNIEFIGFTNATGIQISSIDLSMETDMGGFFFCTDMNFVDEFCLEEPEATCRDGLDDLVDQLAALLPTGDPCDDYYISVALYKLSHIQGDSFWTDGDRLTSAKGCKFFKKAKSAIAWLECTSADTTDIVSSINALLSCVVDIEIQDAIDAGGNPCYIAYAEYYRAVADQAEADGHNRCAAYYRKFAWLYARCS